MRDLTLVAAVFIRWRLLLALPLFMLALFAQTESTAKAASVPPVKVVSVSVSNAATASASCAPGDFATGGGWDISGGLNNILVSIPTPMTGTPTGWTVGIIGTLPSTLTVFVLCMTPVTIGGSTTTTTVVEADKVFTFPDFTGGGATANCPTGDFATGGGFAASGDRDILTSQPSPFLGIRPTGWNGVFSGNGLAKGSTEKVFAICMAPVTIGTVSTSASVAVSSAHIGPASVTLLPPATCTGGDFATGGGINYFPDTDPVFGADLDAKTLRASNPTSGTPPTGWSDRFGVSIPPVFGGTAFDFAVCLHVPAEFTATLTFANGSTYIAGTWTNQNVIVTFTCTQGGTALTPNPTAVTISTEGANQSATSTCKDLSGQTLTLTVSNINIDKSPPTITAVATLPGGATYTPGTWTNQPVTVTFRCTDALSGVASVTQPVTLASDGDNQTVTGTCTDLAGNQASTTLSNIRIDRAPPVIQMSAATNSGPYLSGTWTNQDVTVTIACSDALSGVVTPLRLVTITTEGANQSVTGTCVDLAGNSVSATFGGIDIDKTLPIITVSAVSNGLAYSAGTWTNKPVTVTFACTDALSGVQSVSPPATFSTQGANQSAIGICTDRAGNSAQAVFSPINIDLTAPIITWTLTVGPTVTTCASAACQVTLVTSQSIVATCQTTNQPPLSPITTDGCLAASTTLAATCGTALLPFGTQVLTATSVDAAANSTTSKLSVTCNIATMSTLRTLTNQFVTNKRVAASLVKKLDQAERAFARGNIAAGNAALRAYIKQLHSQIGKSVSAANAATLTNIAIALERAPSCSEDDGQGNCDRESGGGDHGQSESQDQGQSGHAHPKRNQAINE